jgi:hypothetical protein
MDEDLRGHGTSIGVTVHACSCMVYVVYILFTRWFEKDVKQPGDDCGRNFGQIDFLAFAGRRL